MLSHHFCLEILSGLHAATVIGVHIMTILLQVQLNIPIEPPESTWSCPQDNLLLRILPPYNLSYSILIHLRRGTTQLSFEGTVVIKRLIHLHNCQCHHFITLLVQIEDVQGRIVLLEISLKNEVERKTVFTLMLAERGWLLQRFIQVAIVRSEALISDLLHTPKDIFLSTLVAFIVEGLSALQQMLSREGVSLIFLQGNCIGDNLGQLLRPCITCTDALGGNGIVGVLDDTGLHTHVELCGDCQDQGKDSQDDDQSLHQQIYIPLQLQNHKGVGGRGIWGSLMSGIFIRAGLGGRARGLIPPLAKGISAMGCCLKTFSAMMGALNTKEGILLMALGLFQASKRSAKPPCFYPLVSFLTAYSTRICLPERNCPFICAAAASELLKLSQLTKPCPLLLPSQGSRVILVLMTMPKLLKVSQSSFSSTSGSRLPMKTLAPTS